jgi:hypothetical protein
MLAWRNRLDAAIGLLIVGGRYIDFVAAVAASAFVVAYAIVSAANLSVIEEQAASITKFVPK